MAYGAKRGIKRPGEFGIIDIAGLGLAGATGIISALITDYQQKGEASSLFTINQWAAMLGDLLGYGPVPLWTVLLSLIAAGALSIFYFQPITRQGAFAQGFGLLAVIMTAVPADLASGLQSAGAAAFDLNPISVSREAARPEGIVHAAYESQSARVYEAQETSESRYVVELNIIFPGGVPSDVSAMIRRGELRGRLHNADTNQTFNLFRSAGGDVVVRGDGLVIRAGVPANASEAKLWVRIEAVGYAIEEQSAEASIDAPLNWTVTMRPSSMPLFFQRLGKSYWF